MLDSAAFRFVPARSTARGTAKRNGRVMASASIPFRVFDVAIKLSGVIGPPETR